MSYAMPMLRGRDPYNQVLNMARITSYNVCYTKLLRPIETMLVSSIGTKNALDLARANGAGFLIASTSECYGDPLEHPQKETYWGHVN